ncbi:hypothetical protein [Falsiroseomonas sp. HW251]|uniref:hypothetical protein n=1 Tax=Falsiroseomonas sp. HW251 TaxID=3390998 RepID=UPI003D319505
MIAAGAVYFAAIFGLGFLLGVVRTLLLEPWLGAAWAVAAEGVPMVAAMAVAAPWAARLFDMSPDLLPRLGMGLVALALLVLAETALDALLRGRVLWAERFQTTAGLIGLALQVIFAAMPLIRRRA